MSRLYSQSLGNAGTIEGSVLDPSGAAIAKAVVTLHNPVTNYMQSTTSGADGSFRLVNIPPNPYHLEIAMPGFLAYSHDITVRNAVPLRIKANLALAGSQQTITVEAAGSDMLELTPSAHTDADRSLISKLPSIDPGGGLSQAITYSTGAVAADANGFFHPLGDHAQISFVIDGQPISDQQSKVFSTQIPLNALAGMELITGSPDAQYRRQDQPGGATPPRAPASAPTKPFGNRVRRLGLVRNLGWQRTLDSAGESEVRKLPGGQWRRQSGHFLDTPEVPPFARQRKQRDPFSTASTGSPTAETSFHLNLFAARNWFQVPNSYDQLSQDQQPARAHLEHRSRLSAHLQRPHAADRQSLIRAG